VIRVAAVGDVHVGVDSVGSLRPHLEHLREQADLFLLAGDLTKRGSPEETEVLVGEVGGLGLPTFAVLGNHDYHVDQQDRMVDRLESVGVQVVEGRAVRLDVDGTTVGIAGTKGFGGGFLGGCATDFGEPEIKAFVSHGKRLASRLEAALLDVADADARIALVHYSPVEATLAGERAEVYPFLGSYLLAEAIDHAGADLVVHGHSHNGTEQGFTPGGVVVRNVAQPVIGHAYRIYCLAGGDELECAPALAAGGA